MLSVCIPVFNQDVRPLVVELIEQLEMLGTTYEIILLDDASKSDFQSKLRRLATEMGIRFVAHEVNQGRSVSRNRLATEAKYDHLLFLDDDSRLCHPEFISRYLESIKEYDCIYGGTRYPDQVPQGFQLHWNYGRTQEARTVSERKLNPYLGFKTNNFVIRRSVILEHPFDESLVRYGHEDSLLASELQLAGVPIAHIDNPVRHLGLHDDQQFLSRVEEATTHLVQLEKDGKLIGFTRLQLWSARTSAWGLTPMVRPYLRYSMRRWRRQLMMAYNRRLLMLYKWAIYEVQKTKIST